jgi:hypothetical protein
VRDSNLLWQTYQQAKFYRCRASELLHIEDPIAAYFLDRAVFAFGQALVHELDKCQSKTKEETEQKQMRVLRKWVPKAVDASGSSATRKEFADPASRSI